MCKPQIACSLYLMIHFSLDFKLTIFKKGVLMYHSRRSTWNLIAILSITNLLSRKPLLPGHCTLLLKFFTVGPSSVNVAKERDFAGKHKIAMNWKRVWFFVNLFMVYFIFSRDFSVTLVMGHSNEFYLNIESCLGFSSV